ncbi:hypothetical protein [Bacteroides intestinalis]
MKNEKSTFSVLFYLKKDKMKKNGLVPGKSSVSCPLKPSDSAPLC